MPAMAKIAATICERREEWGRVGQGGGGDGGGERQRGDERHGAARAGGDKDGQSFMALRGINVRTYSAVAATVMSLPGQGVVMM